MGGKDILMVRKTHWLVFDHFLRLFPTAAKSASINSCAKRGTF